MKNQQARKEIQCQKKEAVKTMDGEIRNIVRSQSDAIACLVPYGTKYITEQQLIYVAYQGYSERSAKNRLSGLVESDLLGSFRITLPPGAHSAIDPYQLPLQGGGLGGCTRLAPAGTSGDRDQVTKVFYLGAEGERWVSSLVPLFRSASHPVKPFTRDNWSHELSVTRLFIAMLKGSRPDRLEALQKWNWLTPYRGTSVTISAHSQTAVRKLTPDSIIKFQGRGRTIFLEMDRGTKSLSSLPHERKFSETIAGNLQAYQSKFMDIKLRNESNAAPVLPQLIYVVPSEERALQIRHQFGLTPCLSVQEGLEPKAFCMPEAMRFLWEWAYRTEFIPEQKPLKQPEPIETCSKLDIRKVLNFIARQNKEDSAMPIEEINRLYRFANS